MTVRMSHFFHAVGLVVALVASSAQAAERLISTDGFVTDLIFALAADAQLVGVDVTSELPANYRPVANVGYHRTLSAEGLLTLRPTQVIGSEFMGPAAVVSALKKSQVTVTQLPMAHTPAQLKQNITTLAQRLARDPSSILARMDAELATLAALPLTDRRVAVLLTTDPQKLRLAGRGTSGDAFVQLLQAQNVATFTNYQSVSAESLLALQPQLIVVIGREPTQATSALLRQHAILKNTPAGAQGRIITVDGGALIAGLSPAAITRALAVAQRFHGTERDRVATR